MLFAVSEATVPKISVILRKSYGAGYFVMNGLAYEADYIVAWPTAEIAVMGPDGAVNIIHRKTIEALPEEEQAAKRLELAEEIRANIASVQKDAAADAAFRIEQFVLQIHQFLVAATRSREVTAKGLIVKEAGAQFDPAIVGAFLAAERAFMAVREQFEGSAATALAA